MVNLSLIKNWHEKAKEDYFSRYIFEYLAFEAFLKKYKYSEDEIRKRAGNTKERSYIQNLKNDAPYVDRWKSLLQKNGNLNKLMRELISFLNNEPFMLTTNWWNCLSFDHGQCSPNNPKGVLVHEEDFGNIVEFWYQVRNNLFHAGKNPDNKRDEDLVMYAYNTLSVFMEEVLLPEMEEKTLHPAIWEEFEHKFFKGEAEVTLRVGAYEACANIYELLFIEDKYLPLILNGNQIDRHYIIKKLSFNLTNLYGDPYLFKEEWERIVSRATSPEKKKELANYFKDVAPLLKEIIPNLNLF